MVAAAEALAHTQSGANVRVLFPAAALTGSLAAVKFPESPLLGIGTLAR